MFDISSLKNGTQKELEINESIEFPKEMLKNTEIQRLENVKVKGFIRRIEDDLYHISIKIEGNMVLLCARSLEEVNYPINTTYDKTISEIQENDENQVIFQNSLDIFGIVWENIVLEVPLRVIKEDAEFLKEGNGWNLVDENDIKRDSPFSELKSMLDMEGKE